MATIMGSTGFKVPTATGEDHNSWGTPSNAYASDDARATSENTGDMQDYYNFDFGTIPSGATNIKINVSLEMLSFGGAGGLNVNCSHDGGTNYNTNQTLTLISSSDATRTINSDFGRTWAASDFTNANFRIRVENANGSFDVDIDLLQVAISYTNPSSEYLTRVYDSFTEGSDTNLSSHNPDNGTAASWAEFQDVGTADLRVDSATDAVEGTASLSDGSHYTNSTSFAGADYTVSAEVDAFVTSGSDDPLYLFGRVQNDPEDFYAVELLLGTGITLYKRAANATPTTGWTSLGSDSTNPVTGDRVELEMIGSAIKVYKNGIAIISVTDSTYSAAGLGGLGIGSFRVAGHDQDTGNRWDDFYIIQATTPFFGGNQAIPPRKKFEVIGY